jgi:hypothetical protein
MSCFSRITGIKDVRQAGTLILKEDAMNGCRLLLSHIRTVCPTIHLTRLRALLTAVETATQQHRLTLTDLGRVLKSPALVKHNITCMDRLLGNGRLSAERTGLYTVVTQWILAQVTAPLVLVDWSTLTPDHHWHVLRASIPVQGRALPLYEEVHTLQSLTNRHAHRAVLHQLRAVLPGHVCPILVTDAGVRGTWFRLVEDWWKRWAGIGWGGSATARWCTNRRATRGSPVKPCTTRPRRHPPG